MAAPAIPGIRPCCCRDNNPGAANIRREYLSTSFCLPEPTLCVCIQLLEYFPDEKHVTASVWLEK